MSSNFHSRHGFLEIRKTPNVPILESNFSVHVSETGRLLHTFYGAKPFRELSRGQIADLMAEAYRAGREDALGLDRHTSTVDGAAAHEQRGNW